MGIGCQGRRTSTKRGTSSTEYRRVAIDRKWSNIHAHSLPVSPPCYSLHAFPLSVCDELPCSASSCLHFCSLEEFPGVRSHSDRVRRLKFRNSPGFQIHLPLRDGILDSNEAIGDFRHEDPGRESATPGQHVGLAVPILQDDPRRRRGPPTEVSLLWRHLERRERGRGPAFTFSIEDQLSTSTSYRTCMGLLVSILVDLRRIQTADSTLFKTR